MNKRKKSGKAITGVMLMLFLTVAVLVSAVSVSAASGVKKTNVKATIAGSSNTAPTGHCLLKREDPHHISALQPREGIWPPENQT